MYTTLTPELIEQVSNLSEEDRTMLFVQTQDKEYTEDELQAELQARWDEYVANTSMAISMDDFLNRMDQRIASRPSS
jgi:putative addiction module component (TIGR02574 family)